MSLLFPFLTRLIVLVLISASSVLISRWLRLRRKRNGLPLPPGPPGELVLGHLRIIPSEKAEFEYMKWSEQYKSDILSLNVLGQPVIVLNSAKAAVDLLDKRGANYCDRPRFVLFEVMGWGKTLTFLRWGPDFRMHRRILQKNFQKSNIIRYRPLQEREARTMLRGLIESPQNWENVVRRFATAVVLGIGFGIQIKSANDPLIQVATDASHALGHGGAPAGTPVDFFPFLKFFPRVLQDRCLRFANDWSWAICKLHDEPFRAVMTSERKEECLVNAMLCQREEQSSKGNPPELSFDDIKGAAGAVFAAGQDTTWATMMVFTINMVLHRDVQTTAQQALDAVVGRSRLPTFDDRANLPYLEYVVQETLRWCPVSPMGVPHRSLADDVYDGYFIPAGSYVYANARAITHDRATYHDPDTFDPSRYVSISEGGRGEPFPNGQFGFGRRVCVGKHLAEASVWIAIATMLSTMDFKKALDEQGREITPVVELTNGLTSHPKTFPCRIIPRDRQGAEVIRKA